MASYIYTATGSSQLSAAILTDKVRISTTTSAIAIAIGNSSVTANLVNCEIIPATERFFFEGIKQIFGKQSEFD